MAKKSHRITKIAKRFLKELKKYGLRIKYLILYGFYANGHSREDSDIDFAVISLDFSSKSIVKRQEFLGDAIFNIKEPIEPLGYTIDEYKHCEKDSFLNEIKRSGKTIYSNPKLK